MTGEEKIQTTLKLIHTEYRKLLKGDSIEINSPSFEKIGLPLDEQTAVLDILRDDYKCINYRTVRVFEDESKLAPNDLRDIAEIASLNGLPEEYIKKSFLELTTYKVTILENLDVIVKTLSKGATLVNSHSTSVAEVSLNRSTKTVRLTYNGISRDLKKFKSLQNINHIFLSNLLNSPDEPLDRQLLGIAKYSSKVKDLPKTAGFIGELKNIFFDINSEKQTLALHPKKTLTPKEAEIVSSFVNNK